jgi:hypothetical protein
MNPKGYFGNEQELRNQLNDLKIARLSTKDQNEIRKIRNIEAPLISQLKQIERERNLRKSQNI